MLDQLRGAARIGVFHAQNGRRLEGSNEAFGARFVRGNNVVYHAQSGCHFGAGALLQQFASPRQDDGKQRTRGACARRFQLADVLRPQHVEEPRDDNCGPAREAACAAPSLARRLAR
jgi:hypothetical protein